MRREFSVRLSSDLARWVRSQSDSATEVLRRVADSGAKGRVSVSVADPGPGPVRITVRWPETMIEPVCLLTRSPEPLVAFRKLALAGARAALPALAPRPALPAVGGGTFARPLVSEVGQSSRGSPAARATALLDALRGFPRWLGVLLFMILILAVPLALCLLASARTSRQVDNEPSAAGEPWTPGPKSNLTRAVWGD